MSTPVSMNGPRTDLVKKSHPGASAGAASIFWLCATSSTILHLQSQYHDHMDADDDIAIDPIDVDDDYPAVADLDTVEVDDLKPDAVVVKHAREAVRERVLKRYAGQLNAIDMAKAVKDELTPLTAPAERGAILETAMVKLALDILAENVKAKSVREAAQAIEILARVQGISQAGTTDRLPPGTRMDIFARVTQAVEHTRSDLTKLPETTREAIEATASED